MNRQGHKRSTNRFFNRTYSLTLFAAIASQLFVGCATAQRSDETVDAILRKENALIERLQAERAQPEIEQGVSENASLTKAEAHLSLALDELLNANKVIQSKILKQNQQEVRYGQSERNHD
jgi:hypothetical protein